MHEKQLTEHRLNDDTLAIQTGRIIDNSNVHELVKVIAHAQMKNYKYIILDMATLEFLSSAGVGAIFSRVSTSREQGGDVVLCNVSESILYVLRELDLVDHLTIRATEKEAAELCGVAS